MATATVRIGKKNIIVSGQSRTSVERMIRRIWPDCRVKKVLPKHYVVVPRIPQ